MRKILGKIVVIGVFLLIGTGWIPTGDAAEKPESSRAKYGFLLIGDGMGENSIRLFREQFSETAFDQLGEPVATGTNNAEGGVTDSAAAGTALACGVKTLNGAIGVDASGKPVQSLARLLQRRGVKIGIISTVGINDATPGTHYGNRLSRKEYAGVLSDLFASGFDFFGASRLLRPEGFSDKDLAFLLKRNHYNLLTGREGLEQLDPEKKNFFYGVTETIDDDAFLKPDPTLSQVVAAAIRTLDNPKGFFLVIEGGAIDHGNHANDSGAMVREMVEFDKAIKTVLAFADRHPAETLVVVTADHTTGGIEWEVGGKSRPGFWQAQELPNGALARRLEKMRKAGADQASLIQAACQATGIAVPDSHSKDYADLQKAAALFLAGKTTRKDDMTNYGKYNPLVIETFRQRDRQNGFRYTTFGHTAKPVWTYAVGVGAERFREPLENVMIPRRISEAMTGRDLLEDAMGEWPFPKAEVKEHLSMQSVGPDFFQCRYTRNGAAPLTFTLREKGEKVQVKKTNAPFGWVKFTDLKPASDYELTVSEGKREMARWSFQTLPQPEGEPLLRGAVLADAHLSQGPDNPGMRLHSRSAAILQGVRMTLEKDHADLLLLPGDVTDRSRASELKLFRKTFSGAPLALVAVPGNHDRLSSREFAAEWKKLFGTPSGWEEHKGVQIIRLDTGDGRLNKPGNLEAIQRLDLTKPALILSHYQLVKDDHITDPDAAIKDMDQPACRAMLERIAAARAIVLVGHKNLASITTIGDRVPQINCPQMTQYPNGYLLFRLYPEGMLYSYAPSADEWIEEYSRRCSGSVAAREKHAFRCWNGFLRWPDAVSEKQ